MAAEETFDLFKKLEHYTADIEQKLRLRIFEEGIFLSPVDREIANDILDALKKRLKAKEIDIFPYCAAVGALDKLVPIKNQRGYRKIADINITPLMEKTILSRIESEEVDVAAQEGSWGILPGEVRRLIADNCNLLIEMATNCTVRCSFCALANKGAIEKKMSFDSVLAIVKFFHDNQKIPGDRYVTDGLYWGTDPFDTKWRTGDGELDYSNLAEEYWKTAQGKQRDLYTSTAVPIGEEMRVLRFAGIFAQKKKEGEIRSSIPLRISLTNANKERVGCMRVVLEALHGSSVISPDIIEISENRSDKVAMRGNAWTDENQIISTWDVTGPNCRDDVVIGVNSVDGVIMQAASNERPIGEIRFPVMQVSEGAARYTIPCHQHKANLQSARLNDIYPPSSVVEIEVNNSGSLQVAARTLTEDPHRAFLRMVGVFHRMAVLRGGKFKDITPADKAEFCKILASEIELVQSYLDLGSDNWSMKAYMKLFKGEGYF